MKNVKLHITIITSGILVLMVSCFTNKTLIHDIESDFFPISINGNWLLTDSLGNKIDAKQFDELRLFSFGLAVAKKDGKYGYINNKGEWAIKPKYESANDFYYNCAEVQSNQETLNINRKGKKIKYDDCRESKLVPSCYEGSKMETIFNVEEYIITNGNKFAIRYEQVSDTTKFIYDSVIAFDRSFFVVEVDGKFGFFFRPTPRVYNGNIYIGDTIERYQYDEIVVIPPKVNQYSDLFHDLSKVHKYRIGEKWGVLDWQQQKITEPIYDSINLQIDEEYYLVEFDKSKFGYIDKFGNEMFKRVVTETYN